MRTARRPALLIEAAGLRDDLLAVNGAAVNVREYRGPHIALSVIRLRELWWRDRDNHKWS
jgi:hypothetical protein